MMRPDYNLQVISGEARAVQRAVRFYAGLVRIIGNIQLAATLTTLAVVLIGYVDSQSHD
jgi:hypothetical protein